MHDLPDAYERRAKEMEDRQDRRYQKCTLQQKVQFWTSAELEIGETIKLLRERSSTYTQ